MVDPRGSGLLFFMFIRPQPYTCLGIEWAPTEPYSSYPVWELNVLQTTPASRITGPAYMFRRDQEFSETTGPSCRAFHTLKDLM